MGCMPLIFQPIPLLVQEWNGPLHAHAHAIEFNCMPTRSMKIQKLDFDKAGIGFNAVRGIDNHHRVFDEVVRGPPRANEFDRRDAPNGVDARPLEDTDLARAAPSRTDGAQHRHTPSCRTTIARDIGFGHRVMDIGIRRHMQSMHDDFHTH